MTCLRVAALAALLVLLTGCAASSAGEQPRLDRTSGGMISDLGEPLIFARERRGSGPMPAHFIVLVPLAVDAARSGGARLWLACGSNLDLRHLVLDPCAPQGLELSFGAQQARLENLQWQVPAPERRWVDGIVIRAATTVAVDAELLRLLAAAPTLSLAWLSESERPEALSLWRGARSTWTQEDAAAGLRFRATVLPENN